MKINNFNVINTKVKDKQYLAIRYSASDNTKYSIKIDSQEDGTYTPTSIKNALLDLIVKMDKLNTEA